jgi:hypothetical protein
MVWHAIGDFPAGATSEATRLAFDEKLVNPLYVKLVQRQGFTDAGSGNIASGASSSANSSGISIPIPVGQAIRIASVVYSVVDAGNTGFLRVNSAIVLVNATAVQPVRGWSSDYAGTILGASGVIVEASDQELLFWNDWSEFGGIATSLTANCQVDATNLDATAAHALNIAGTLILERYQFNTVGAS